MPSRRTSAIRDELMSAPAPEPGAAARLGNMALRRVMASLVAFAVVTPAAAVTNTHTFGVSATVVAACAIAPRLLSTRLDAGAGAASVPCSSPSALSTIAGPQPIINLTRDAALALATLTIEF